MFQSKKLIKDIVSHSKAKKQGFFREKRVFFSVFSAKISTFPHSMKFSYFSCKKQPSENRRLLENYYKAPDIFITDGE